VPEKDATIIAVCPANNEGRILAGPPTTDLKEAQVDARNYGHRLRDGLGRPPTRALLLRYVLSSLFRIAKVMGWREGTVKATCTPPSPRRRSK